MYRKRSYSGRNNTRTKVRKLLGMSTPKMRMSTRNPPRYQMKSSRDLQVYGGNTTKFSNRQYTKRRQSRYRRNKARKYYRTFKNTFRKISGVALQKVIINNSATASAVPAAQQWVAVHIGSYVSAEVQSQETGQRDLRQLMDNMTNTKFTDDVDGSSKRMIDSCVCDMTVRNIGESRVEIDKYVIAYSEDHEFASFKKLMDESNNNQNSLTSVGTDRLTINNRGVTLFDMGYALKVGKLKILSKDKLFLGPGESANYQHKIKKPLAINLQEIFGETSYVKSGYTITYLFVFKSVVGDGENAIVAVGKTTAYGFRVDGQSIQANANILP